MKAALRTYTPVYEYYSRVGISRELPGTFRRGPKRPGLLAGTPPVLGDLREKKLRDGVELLKARSTKKEGEEVIITVATNEARDLMDAFGLEREDGDRLILDLWLKERRGFANLVDGAKQLGPVESRNVLLARLKTFLRSRAIEVWRTLYARDNPLAQFFWVRFGKVLKRSRKLVESRGVVSLKFAPRHAPPGDHELVKSALHLLIAPTAPVMRERRLRLPTSADKDYERWMVDCLLAADGALKRRTLAELLALRHGETRCAPGQGRPEVVDSMNAEALTELEAGAAWVNEERDESSD